MYRKQTGWQVEKFSLEGNLEGQTTYAQLRAQIQAMQTNGWEILSVFPLGYDPTVAGGKAMLLVTLVKYEWAEEPVPAAKAIKEK